jgi:hypothetical protein
VVDTLQPYQHENYQQKDKIVLGNSQVTQGILDLKQKQNNSNINISST